MVQQQGEFWKKKIEEPETTIRHHDNELAVGSRKSQLAVRQAQIVQRLLQQTHPGLSFPMFVTETTGDLILAKPLYKLGAKALWTKELETLLMKGTVRLVVHSLKDMPTDLPEGVKIAAMLEREDPRDAVVMKANSVYTCLEDLPAGSVVGTSSIRRIALLKRKYPNLLFDSIRGNVNTRLAKLDAPVSVYSCLVLAAAGLQRLKLGHRIAELLDAPEHYYAVGQGALAVETRSDDSRVQELLSYLYDAKTTYRCIAERALMHHLEGGCAVPIGVNSFFNCKHELGLNAIVLSVDGQHSVSDGFAMQVASESDAKSLGIHVASLLIEQGASEILQEIRISENNSSEENSVAEAADTGSGLLIDDTVSSRSTSHLRGP